MPKFTLHRGGEVHHTGDAGEVSKLKAQGWSTDRPVVKPAAPKTLPAVAPAPAPKPATPTK